MIYSLILLGISSYVIFSLGILHMLYLPVVQLLGIISLLVVLFLLRKEKHIVSELFSELRQSKISLIFFSLVLIQACINVVGALGPEIGFDALWYHLTIPKIYLQQGSVSFIPGGLLYYSAMPKLGEMLYIIGLSFDGEIFPKLIHYLFGLVSIGLLYKVLRLYVKPQMAIIGCAIFYGNLVVGWESTSSYIDLIRTACETGAVYCFLLWNKTSSKPWLWYSALLVGFAITSKLLALGSLGLFIVLILYLSYKKKPFTDVSKDIVAFSSIALVIPLPWFMFAYLSTGNPVYPFFTSLYPVSQSLSLLNPVSFVKDILALLLFSPDPISILYLLFVPLLLYSYKRFSDEQKILTLYCLLSLVVWYITPRTGGGRFILPYLPVWSAVIVFVMNLFERDKKWMSVFFLSIAAVCLLSIGYRSLANLKYVPYLVKKESKAQFLQKNLDFSYGDYFDLDGKMKRTIKDNTVLLIGFHNLFYVDFPFVHESWVKKGDTFTYIAVQNAVLPERFRAWKKIYESSDTHVSLYSNDNKVERY